MKDLFVVIGVISTIFIVCVLLMEAYENWRLKIIEEHENNKRKLAENYRNDR